MGANPVPARGFATPFCGLEECFFLRRPPRMGVFAPLQRDVFWLKPMAPNVERAREPKDRKESSRS